MNWCCPEHEVDEIFNQQQRRAVYINNLEQKHNQIPPFKSLHNERVEDQQNSLQKFPPKNVPISNSQSMPALKIFKTRNQSLNKQLQIRKNIVWQRSNRLLDRSTLLREVFTVKSKELNQLTEQINQYFP